VRNYTTTPMGGGKASNAPSASILLLAWKGTEGWCATHSPSNRATVMSATSDSDAEATVALKGDSNFVLRNPLSESSIGQNCNGRVRSDPTGVSLTSTAEIPAAICRPDVLGNPALVIRRSRCLTILATTEKRRGRLTAL
jgi:hypothetical protein